MGPRGLSANRGMGENRPATRSRHKDLYTISLFRNVDRFRDMVVDQGLG